MSLQGGFGIVYACELGKLSGNTAAMAVYARLCGYARVPGGEAFPRTETIAEELGLSVRTVQRALADCVHGHVIERLEDGQWRVIALADPPPTGPGDNLGIPCG